MSKYSKGFETFWASYPKNNRQGKAAAYKKWAEKGLDDKVAMIANHCLERGKRDKKWLDGYVPMPVTFINQERWDDEYETVQAKSDPLKLRPIMDEGPDINTYVLRANRVLFAYMRHHNGVPEGAMENMIRNKNQFAQLCEERKPDHQLSTEEEKAFHDETADDLKRLHRSFDAIVQKYTKETAE